MIILGKCPPGAIPGPGAISEKQQCCRREEGVAAWNFLKARLKQATVAFETALSRHGRALHAAKTVTEGLVKAIAEEVARNRTGHAGYGPGARQGSAPATAITLNKSA